MNSKKAVLSLLLSATLLSGMIGSLSAAADVSLGYPTDNSFLKRTESYGCGGGCSSDISYIVASYECRSAVNNNTKVWIPIASFSPNSSSHMFSFLMNYSSFSSFPFPYFNISGSAGTQDGPWLVCSGYRADGSLVNVSRKKVSFIQGSMNTTEDEYKNVDPNFNYQYWGSSSLKDTATGSIVNIPLSQRPSCRYVYNCLAYALNKTNNGWMTLNNVDLLSVKTELEDVYGLSTNNYNNHMNSNFIVYGIQHQNDIWQSEVTHFAKVVSWYSDGAPKAIQSKWGGMEVVLSEGTNPFSTQSGYGSPLLYMNLPL